jgi:hypothetical protein
MSGNTRYHEIRWNVQISAYDFDPGNLLVGLALQPPRREAFRPITAGFASLRKSWLGRLS